MENIRLSTGNVLFIGLTASVFMLGGLATIHYLSRRDVPVLSPTARGAADFISAATNVKAA